MRNPELPPSPHEVSRDRPAGCSPAQWILAFLTLAGALASYLVDTHQDLVGFVLFLTLISLLLVLSTLKELFYRGLPGKFFLLASTFFFFWLESVGAILEEPIFRVPSPLPLLSTQFPVPLIQLAFLYIALFQFMLLVGYSFRPQLNGLTRWLSLRRDTSGPEGRVLVWIFAACAVIPLLLSYDLSLAKVWRALVVARAEGAPDAHDIGLLHYLYFIGMYGVALLWSRWFVGSGSNRLGILCLLIPSTLPFILLGTRHLWLFVIIPAVVILIRWHSGHFRLAILLRWSLLALAILLSIQIQLALRNKGWHHVDELESYQLNFFDSTGQFKALLFAAYLVPEVHDYFREPAEIYFLTHWIPRKLWPEKPIMRSWEFYNRSYARGAAFNVTPSIIGQFHLNWGILGVLAIGVWIGFLAYVADRALLSIDLDSQLYIGAVIGMFYVFLISSYRFYSPVYFTYFAFAFLASFAVTRRGVSPQGQLQSSWQADPQTTL